jgi:hypothetical protein
MIKLFERQKGRVLPPEDLERFADGKVHRLKRGRDFSGSVWSFRKAMAAQSSATGRPVRTVPDKLQPDRYCWIQFGVAKVGPGEPCVCGGTDIVRVHLYWGRCRGCGALLELLRAQSAPVGVTETRLDSFADVSLYRHAIDGASERCFGTARRADDAIVFLSVVFPLDDGHRIEHPKVPGHWYYLVHEMPAEQIALLVDLEAIERGVPVSWHVEEDSGSLQEADFDPAPG